MPPDSCQQGCLEAATNPMPQQQHHQVACWSLFFMNPFVGVAVDTSWVCHMMGASHVLGVFC